MSGARRCGWLSCGGTGRTRVRGFRRRGVRAPRPRVAGSDSYVAARRARSDRFDTWSRAFECRGRGKWRLVARDRGLHAIVPYGRSAAAKPLTAGSIAIKGFQQHASQRHTRAEAAARTLICARFSQGQLPRLPAPNSRRKGAVYS